jgi:DNA-binding response OmpR family regulator
MFRFLDVQERALYRSSTAGAGLAAGRRDPLPESCLRRILAIEDDPDNRSLLEIALGDVAGLEITFRSDGRDAEAAVREIRPDVVLVDLMLPDRDGESVIEALQPLRAHQPFLVVVVTAVTEPRWRNPSTPGWIDDLVRKPFHPLQLADRLRRLWSTRVASSAPSAGEP